MDFSAAAAAVARRHVAFCRPFLAIIAAVVALLLLTAPGARAAGPAATFTAEATPAKARPGETITVTVTAQVKEPYHIYSVAPVQGAGPDPTTVTVSGPGLKALGGVTESAPKRSFDPNFQIEVGYHAGRPTFTQRLQVPAGAKPTARLPLAVSVRYMACTETSCLPPRTVNVPGVAVAIEKGAPRPQYAAPAAGAASDTSKPADTRAARFQASIAPATARPGETVVLTVKAEIKEPYHIYSVVPPAKQPGPEPTTLTVEAAPLTPIGGVAESAPKREMDPNFEMEVGYHGGTATFTQRLQVPETAQPGASVPVKTTVRFMACTDKSCLPPKNVDLTGLALAIEAGPPRAEYSGTAAVPTDAPTPPGAATSAATSGATSNQQQGSIWPFLLAAFGAGLIALVTPCVFPMIPVTLAFFTKQATAGGEADARAAQRAVVRLAAVYSLGIVVSFTLIGAVLAATIGATGANRLFTNPWLNLAFATLFVVFGLALLEIVELRLPAGLQRFAGGGSGQRRGGTLGVLGMGLAFVAAAFTCTAPFIGTVLVAAAAASSGAQWLRPVLGMAAFASALALPFFVLSLFPSLLSRLPRSGGWLTTVKGAMGFLEIAAALKFLSNADMVMGWNLLPRPLFLALWGIVGLAGALWLLGVLRLGYTTPEGRPTPARAAWAVAFAALGMYCLYGVTGRPLAGAVVAFLPPADYGLPAGATSGDHGGLTWVKSLDEGLARAKAENKPVLIDFTGYACTNCRWMENNIFPQPVVQSEMRNFVLVQLYTDGVDQASVDNQAYQLKTFDDVSLPLYAILSPDGTPGARSGGITRDPDAFARFLRTGREQELASRQRKGAETTTASAR